MINLTNIRIHENPQATRGIVKVCRWNSVLGGIEEVGIIDLYSNTITGQVHLGKDYYLHKDDIEDLKDYIDKQKIKKVPTLESTRNPFQFRYGPFGWWDPFNRKIVR